MADKKPKKMPEGYVKFRNTGSKRYPLRRTVRIPRAEADQLVKEGKGTIVK